jgi:hypothetical protein
MISITFFQGQAYLVALRQVAPALWVETGEVFTAELDRKSLSQTIDEVRNSRPPRPRVPRSAFETHPTAVERRLGTSSWRKMAQSGAVFADVTWWKNRVDIVLSPKGSNSREKIDFAHPIELEPNIDSEGIATVLLQEWASRQGPQP